MARISRPQPTPTPSRAQSFPTGFSAPRISSYAPLDRASPPHQFRDRCHWNEYNSDKVVMREHHLVQRNSGALHEGGQLFYLDEQWGSGHQHSRRIYKCRFVHLRGLRAFPSATNQLRRNHECDPGGSRPPDGMRVLLYKHLHARFGQPDQHVSRHKLHFGRRAEPERFDQRHQCRA